MIEVLSSIRRLSVNQPAGNDNLQHVEVKLGML